MPDPSLSLLTEAELPAWILRRLGAPQTLVELTKEQLDDAVEAAKRWFAGKKGVTRSGSFELLAGQQEYVLPEDVDGVSELAFPESPLDLSLSIAPGFFMPDQQIPYHALAAPQSGGLYSSLTQSMQYIETAKRVLGIELDWSYDPVAHKLTVFPNPKQSGTVKYEYKSRNFTLDQLRERDHDLLKRYALAVAMETLGWVRSKREALGANGPVTLNGDKLLERSAEAVENLEKEIGASSMPMAFYSG